MGIFVENESKRIRAGMEEGREDDFGGGEFCRGRVEGCGELVTPL